MARKRSPNYPALSLPEAIERIKDVHKEQQTTAEPREVVLQHMGYAGVSGRSLKSISALIKYGLLEDAGGNELRVSRRALAILFPDPEDPTAKQQALLDAAHNPSLFAAIFDKWKTTRPSEASLKSFLAHKEFNTNSVEQVARAFYETFDLVNDLLGSYDSSGRKPADDDDDEEEEDAMEQTPHQPAKVDTGGAKTSIPSSVNSTKPVFDFETVQINTRIDNQEDLAELVSRLEQIKSMLPKKGQN
jgi:hypothetical protein